MSKQTDRFRPTSDDRALEETEAHMPLRRAVPEDEESEGHRMYSDKNIKHDVDDVTWDEDETEGHRSYSSSDTSVKHDVDDVTWDDDETEGHRFSSSDAGVKHDVDDVVWNDEDGTEGHSLRIKG